MFDQLVLPLQGWYPISRNWTPLDDPDSHPGHQTGAQKTKGHVRRPADDKSVRNFFFFLFSFRSLSLFLFLFAIRI